MLSYDIAVHTTSGRRIGFHQLGGPLGLDWPTRRDRLGDGEDIFSTNVFALEKALRTATTRALVAKDRALS
jgi:hypothetical protein